MGKVIKAVYENGVFKPLEKVNLKDGERVKIRVERSLMEIIKSYQEIFKLRKEDIEEFLREWR
jgi:predicted DNA-binding antitoxin AbrB/MazE fold protein